MKKKGYLTKRTIFGEKASNRFPIHFTSREMDKPLVILRTILHHRKSINEITVNGIKGSGVVISRCTNSSEINGQICHFDETLEPGIVFDVEAVEVDAAMPREVVGFQEVLDLVAVDIQGENLVRGFGHELLAEVGADEAAGADHADCERRDGVAVEIHA